MFEKVQTVFNIHSLCAAMSIDELLMAHIFFSCEAIVFLCALPTMQRNVHALFVEYPGQCSF